MSTILVVDDSELDRTHVGGLLAHEPQWAIAFAENGVDALRHFKHAAPDLLLTDLFMPEMDGLQLVETVRATYPTVPIILMTSKGNEEIAVEALQRGASSYVPKRLLDRYLKITVAHLLRAAREQRSREKLLGSMKANQCVFSLSSESDLIPSLVGYFQESMSHMGLCDEGERLRVSVALEEALTNAIYHGNLEVSSDLRELDDNSYYRLIGERRSQFPYCNRLVQVRVRMTDREAEFVIADEGPGFDVSALPDPTDPKNLEKASGRGIMLMRTFMDEVKFNDTGNEVRLVKRVKSRPAAPLDARIFDLETANGALIVSVLKNVTSLSDEHLAGELEKVLDRINGTKATRVVIDLASVSRFGSSFLESLRRIWATVRSWGGVAAICNVSSLGHEVLQMARFNDLFLIRATRRDALAALSDLSRM